jgi:Protein of unknown function (DUF3455)
MENRMTSNALENQTTRRTPLIAWAATLAVAVTVLLPQPAFAKHVRPPPVPANLNVPEGNTAFLVGHAIGTQNYVCLPSGAGFAYVLFTPEATLFDNHGKQIITHFFSPNLAPSDPSEIAGTIRATWQDSDDTSTVWAKATDSASHASDPDFVADGAVAWLKLAVVGAKDGPRDGDTLSDTTFVQRLNTSGGVAPADCTSLADVGKQKFVPYTADYFFYSADDGN